MTQPYQPLPPQPPTPPKPPKKRRTVPLWVFILTLSLVAFASCGVGAGIGSSGGGEPVAASGTAEQDLDSRAAKLDARERKLDAREGVLDERTKTLDDREAKLDQKEEKKAKQKAANTIPGDGVFLVGEDVKPGTYRTQGSAGLGCYWARLSGTSGNFDEIITNGNAEGPTTVTIAKSDKAFETSGCQEWKRR